MGSVTPTSDDGPDPPEKQVRYDAGMLTTRAKEAIAPNELVCAIPAKLTLSATRARQHPVLSEIFASHPDLFKSTPKRDHYALVITVMYERCLGEQSFFQPWFDAVELLDLPANFKETTL